MAGPDTCCVVLYYVCVRVFSFDLWGMAFDGVCDDMHVRVIAEFIYWWFDASASTVHQGELVLWSYP